MIPPLLSPLSWELELVDEDDGELPKRSVVAEESALDADAEPLIEVIVGEPALDELLL